MAAPSYLGQGGAAAVSTAVAAAYPTGLTAGDLLVYYVSSDSSTVGGTPSGWTSCGSAQTGGGITVSAWKKTSNGSETGTVTISGITGGTKGVGFIAAYHAAQVGATVFVQNYLTASDTDTTSTAFTATSASQTVAVDDRLAAMVTSLAPAAGTYSGVATGVTLTSANATLTTTARFAGRTGTNTVYYGLIDGAVTAGGTGAATYSATTVGANAAGSMAFVLIREVQNVNAVAATTSSCIAVAPVVSGGGSSGSVTAVAATGTGLSPVPVVSGGALPTYVGQGTVGALTSAAVPGYPTVSAGDLILLYVFSDSSTLPTPSGFTQVGTTQVGGGMNGAVFYKTAAGTESGTTQSVTATGGTKGVTWLVAYRASVPGNALSMTLSKGSDTDGTNTSYAVTGGSTLTTGSGDLVTVSSSVLTAGAFTGNATALVESQAGATTDALVSRFSGRAQTNTIYYQHADMRVTGGATGAPSFTATTTGANGTGTTLFMQLHEVAGVNGNVNAVAATGTGLAPAGITLAGGTAITAVVATATGAAIGVAVSAQRVVTGGAPASGTGTVIVPSVGVDFVNVAVAATGTGLAPVPVIGNDYVVVVPVATATGLVRKPTPGVDLTLVQSSPATGSVQAIPPGVILSDLFLTAVAATGSALALFPGIYSSSAGYVFTPPGQKRKHHGGHPLFDRLDYTEGQTVLNNGGFFTTKNYVGDDEIVAADKAYLGGHKYPITEAERQALIAAGYADYITQEIVT